jgi:hypothetical protein
MAGVSFRLPNALLSDEDGSALELLRRYYGANPATGATFDGWDSTGTRSADINRFTADDLVAITFLSVRVPPSAAVVLLRDRAAELASLLTELGPDRDLADEAEHRTHSRHGDNRAHKSARHRARVRHARPCP